MTTPDIAGLCERLKTLWLELSDAHAEPPATARIMNALHQSGDTLERQAAEIERLQEALGRIERWFGEFPETGRFWPNEDPTESARPMSYSAVWGSNGERDFMRAVARAALTGEGRA